MFLETTAKSSIEYAQRNLFLRFFATIMFFFIVIMFGVGVMLFQQIDSEQKKLLNSIANEYQRILSNHGGDTLTNIAVSNPQQLIEFKIAMFEVQTEQALQRVAGSNFPINDIDLHDFYWTSHSWYRIYDSPNYLSILLTGKQAFWLVLDLETQLNLKYKQWQWIAVVLALLCFIISIVVWRLIRSTLLPLHRLASVVDQTNGWAIDSFDKIEEQQPTNNNKGLEVLHFSINHIIRRLVTTIHSLESTVDAIAHDLRTPLARISLSTEKALSKPISGQGKDLKHLQDALSDCAESAQQANHMLTTLMGIHDEVSGKHSIETSDIELRVFVREIVSYYQELAEENGIIIATDGLIHCHVNTDPGRLTQIMVNLLDNSLKYSEKGETITLVCGLLHSNKVFIDVIDQGIGIDEKYHQLIFKRLYRIDASRSNSGYGLGLAQVKTITKTLGGSIEVHSQKGKGSCFRIILPIKK